MLPTLGHDTLPGEKQEFVLNHGCEGHPPWATLHSPTQALDSPWEVHPSPSHYEVQHLMVSVPRVGPSEKISQKSTPKDLHHEWGEPGEAHQAQPPLPLHEVAQGGEGEGMVSPGVCLGCEDTLQEGLTGHPLGQQQSLGPLLVITGSTGGRRGVTSYSDHGAAGKLP